jgi:hypothetical protein
MIAQLTSAQRRLLKEQEETLKTAPMAGDASSAPVKQTPALEPALNAEMSGDGQEDGTMGTSDAERVRSALKAVEKLQRAAADLEAARFTIQQEYSDFTLAKKLDYLKQELVTIIGKTKEHIARSSTNSPEAKQEMATWLGLGQ